MEFADETVTGNSQIISTEGERIYLGISDDVNANGKVDILDATRIQRYLAGFDVDDPERVELCGAITSGEVSIIDATVIQRYLVGFDNEYGIGEYM